MGTSVGLSGKCKCPFGAEAAPFIPVPHNMTSMGLPTGNIMDMAPIANIVPFGVCKSLSYPPTAAATAAALGVLTPMPCMPLPVSPWVPGDPKVLVQYFPAINDSSTLPCAWGGVIQVDSPGQAKLALS